MTRRQGHRLNSSLPNDFMILSVATEAVSLSGTRRKRLVLQTGFGDLQSLALPELNSPTACLVLIHRVKSTVVSIVNESNLFLQLEVNNVNNTTF